MLLEKTGCGEAWSSLDDDDDTRKVRELVAKLASMVTYHAKGHDQDMGSVLCSGVEL